SEFARMVLEAGKGSEEHRSALRDLAGPRASRFIPAAEEYLNKTPDMSPESMETAHKAEKAQHWLRSNLNRFWDHFISGTPYGDSIPAIGASMADKVTGHGVVTTPADAAKLPLMSMIPKEKSDPLADVLAEKE